MLFFLGLEMLNKCPEVVVHVTWMKCGKLEGMNTSISFEGPW